MDVGVIGTGYMGKNHVRLLSDMKQVSDLFLYDLDPKVTSQLSEYFDCHSSSSLKEMLHTCDAVSLCVPTPLHHEYAMQIIGSGVPLLIEKPICLNTVQGKELVSHIPEGLVVGVGHVERFNPIIEEIKRLINNPLYVEFKRHNPASNRVNSSSVVIDLMIHDIDILQHSFGLPLDEINTLGSPDIAMSLINARGTSVYLSASRKASKKIRMIHIEQEDCTIQGDFMAQEVFIYRKPDQYNIENERYVQENIVEQVQVAKKEPLRTELSTFLNSAKSGVPFPITPEQALLNLEICEKIQSGIVYGY